MEAEIITIGDELLIGQVVDTNSAFIATELNKAGINVYQITSIPDKKDRILNSLEEAKNRVDLVLLTGGLGPTNDDITKNILAGYFNSKLVRNEEVVTSIKNILEKRDVIVNERNLEQADLPDNCEIIFNHFGSASGMWFVKDNVQFISMPGVPFEMKEMLIKQIIPELIKRNKLPVILHKTILTQGIAESVMAEKIKYWEASLPSNIRLAYLPSPGILRLRLSGSNGNRDQLNKEFNKQVEFLKKLLPENIFGYDDDKLEEIIGKLLKKKHQTLSAAESCTGGNVSQLITSVPGASDYFKGSVVAYSNEIKQSVLNVSGETLMNYGAVSQQTVKEMAEGVRKLYHTDYAFAVSGIAGPGGGTAEKPVGTVWIAIASAKEVITRLFHFGDNRGRNIQRATITTLNLLRKELINN
jgi:nicotinamide-nucleotide amidase